MEVFNSEVSNVDIWFKENYLTLNPPKRNYVIFRRDRKFVPSLQSGLTICRQEVVKVTVVRLLRVLLDECLKFSKHVKIVACNTSRYTSIVYKLCRYINLDSLKQTYHTMIYSNINYCISALGASSASVINQSFKEQKAVVRAAMGRPRFAHTLELCQHLSFLMINKIYTYMVALYVRKALD